MAENNNWETFIIGAHNSISGGVHKALDRAIELHTNSCQIFSHNVRSWQKKEFEHEEIENFKDRYQRSNEIKYVVIHTSYLINLASPKEELWKKSIQGLKDELKKADQLGVDHINTHIGAHTGSGREKGLNRIIKALNIISESDVFTSSSVDILLENTAGSGTTLGKDFEEIGYVLNELDRKERFGVCFDTCHGFAAGYPVDNKSGLDSTLNELDEELHIDKLKLIHLNDSKGKLASNKDRHAHIGQGEIGGDGFRNILNHPLLYRLPFIIETPKEKIDGEDGDIVNLRKLKNLRDR